MTQSDITRICLNNVWVMYHKSHTVASNLPPDIKDINHRQDFRNGTFVTLIRKYFSKPLHSECNWTNQFACFDQPMKSDQSDCLFCKFAHTLNISGDTILVAS